MGKSRLLAMGVMAVLGLSAPAQATPVSTPVKIEGAKRKSVACVNENSPECTYVKKGVHGTAEGGCLRLQSDGEIWFKKPVYADVLISHHILPKKLEAVGCAVGQECPESNFPFDPVWLEDGAWVRFYLADFQEKVFAKRNVSGNPGLWVSDESDACLDDGNVTSGLCEYVGRCRAGLIWDRIADFVAAANLSFEVEAVEGQAGKEGNQVVIKDVLLTAESREDVYVWLAKNNKTAGKFGCSETGEDPVGCAATVGMAIGICGPNQTLYTGLGVAKKVGEGGVAVTGNPGIFVYYEGQQLFETRFSDLSKATQ
ncbi:MAG: hypothetical protein HY901_32320 [Deltaproteobacteria bacterium]|nr:hypothetical protein [Deltaproteobacteria bacterium]